MTRTAISLRIPDLSDFARSLAREFEDPPGHLTLLNKLARAAGFRNFQHLRASQKSGEALSAQSLAASAPLTDLPRV